MLNNVHFVLKLVSGRGVMGNSKGDDLPCFLGNYYSPSVNYLRSVMAKLEVADFCLPIFTLDYITVFQPL